VLGADAKIIALARKIQHRRPTGYEGGSGIVQKRTSEPLSGEAKKGVSKGRSSMRRTSPSFLTLPERYEKPRSAGLTHVLDKGIPLGGLQSWLELIAEYVDVLKLGWGTAYITPDVGEKVRMCRAAGVKVSTGGTLLELAATQGRVAEFIDWALESSFEIIEVSNGALGMSVEDKRALIGQLAKHFIVFSEVGSKNALAPVDSTAWHLEANGDLDAGAAYVVLEGRESGTVGLYESDGSVRHGLVEQLVAHANPDRLIFEAPIKSQQAWLINKFGPDVNLGNIAPDDALSLESMRLGLRADTTALAISPKGRRLLHKD